MNAQTSFPVFVTAGFLIWSSAFVMLYAAASAGCAFGWQMETVGPLSLQRLVLLGVWSVHLAAFVPLGLALRRRGSPGDRRSVFADAPFWITAAAFAATVFIGVPGAVLTACA